MASPNPDGDSSSMFMTKTPATSNQPPKKSSIVKTNLLAEVITVKDFFDFMKTAYQVYEQIEGNQDDEAKINWEELTKLTVINHVLEPEERELLYQTLYAEQRPVTSKSESAIERINNETALIGKRFSCSEIEAKGCKRALPEGRVEMLGVWTEANLNCKLNDVINEGILDSILPYLVGYKKPVKTTSVYTPIVKKSTSGTLADVKKPASFGAFVSEKESKDRLGRRKSSVAAAQEKANQKQEGDVQIHVCDELKGLKKDFRCPQKLLVSKMGYFADVTAGQRLEDMDISVHCDIQIFDWLMRWVKRDSILVADWPLLDPHNVVPILVSASFLQMEPLLHDCLIYCHAHMNDIVKTSTNLACLNDALLTRLAAMYTNAELEAIKDKKDKIQSRLYCKMILSLGEPVPETLRGHYATLATLFKCNKCNKLLGRHIAEKVPCQPANMRIDRRGNVISTHIKDTSWSLNEYITWLFGELRSWRRVYWRLWADCHFLYCQLCESHYPVYQMEWCSHHEQGAHMFVADGQPALATGRHPCCGERAYRFETITRNTGCQFREHVPEESGATEAGIMCLYSQFRELIAMRPPQLMFPDRLTQLVTRDSTEDASGRLHCKEVFWWEGIQLMPPRQTLGLLGRLFTSNSKFNQSPKVVGCEVIDGTAKVCSRPTPYQPITCRYCISNRFAISGSSQSNAPGIPPPTIANARPGSPALSAVHTSAQSLSGNCSSGTCPSPDVRELKTKLPPRKGNPKIKTGAGEVADCPDTDLSDESDESDNTAPSEEDAPTRSRPRARVVPASARPTVRRMRATGCGGGARVWACAASARSNQDAQRRYEERAAARMRTALARKHARGTLATPQGGVYARLEAEWRDRLGPRGRPAPSARARPQHLKYK